MTEQNYRQDDPLDPKRWRHLTDEQRNKLIDQLFVTYDCLLPIFEDFERAARHSHEPEERSPCCLALLGEQGVGKTAVARHWMGIARAQQEAPGEEVRVPCLYGSLPAHSTYKGLLAAWLAAFDDPCWSRGTQWNMEGRLRYLIKACRVQLLLIDNVEHLLHQASERVLDTFLDSLRHLISSTEVSAVFIGRPETAEALSRGGDRWERRIGAVHLLQPFEWDRRRPATVREFCSLLREIDRALPLDLSGLDEEEMAYRLFYAADGCAGRLFELIGAAARRAVAIHSAILGNRLFAEVFDEQRAAVARGVKVNPFSTPGFHEM